MNDPRTNPTNSDDCLDKPTVAPLASNGCEEEVLAAGSVVGDYEIVSEIARGGMGVVYRAQHHALDRLVALKMILEFDGKQSDLRTRFENEARAAASLDHPGIVPVFDVGSWHGRPFFAMAYVAGQSLAERLRDGPIPPRQAAEIARDVSDAMSHAHEKRIIHRDLKPANILIDEEGAPRITDFGVSKFLEIESDLTSCGELVGTPHYMPPEQAGGVSRAGGTVGPAADVYSIGAVLYSMLTGRPPFQAASPLEVVAQVMTRQPVPPSNLNVSVSVELEVITLKCLSKNPQDRYASAAHLAADLRRFLADEPIEARAPSLSQKAKLAIREHVLLASVSGSATLLLVLATTLVLASLLQSRREVVALSEELDVTQKRLASERIAVARFMRKNDAGSLGPTFANYEIERLFVAASSLPENQNALALELAAEALQLAVDNDVDPSPQRLELLRSLIPIAGDSEQAPNPKPLLSPQQWLKRARESISSPMTEQQRMLFGLEVSSKSKSKFKSDQPATIAPKEPQ